MVKGNEEMRVRNGNTKIFLSKDKICICVSK